MITLEDINRLAAHSFLEVYGIDEDDNSTIASMCDFSCRNWAEWYYAHRDCEVLRVDACKFAIDPVLPLPVLRVYIAINKEDLTND